MHQSACVKAKKMQLTAILLQATDCLYTSREVI